MKACPYCAEQIQDAAVACKHCGKDLSPQVRPISQTSGTRATGTATGLVVVLLAASAAGAAVLHQQHAQLRAALVADSLARRAADSVAAVTPRFTDLMIGSADIAARGYRFQEFTVLQAGHCAVVGTARGGGDGIEALVLPYDQMVSWQANPQTGEPVWRSGLTTQATLNVDLPKPGAYDLVVSNRAAWLLTHTADTKIQLRCTRAWPPRPVE